MFSTAQGKSVQEIKKQMELMQMVKCECHFNYSTYSVDTECE